MRMQTIYPSSFQTSAQSAHILRKGKVIDPQEDAQNMVERIVQFFYEQEMQFGVSKNVALAQAITLGELMDAKAIVMSTPVLMNVNRFKDRPLSACIMPSPMQTRKELMHEVALLHRQGMGTGFNLNEADNPVAMLNFLNKLAIEGANSGKEDRPVGNIAVLNIYHPAIFKFAQVKINNLEIDWKFNLSVDVDDDFFNKAVRNESIIIDNRSVEAADLLDKICEAAYITGDPGLIFLNRMNARNPVLGLGKYKVTAPCAEVGLIEGESCQFGYLNIAKFVSKTNNQVMVAHEKLAQAAALMTRFLDDATEHNLRVYSSPRTIDVMSKKRKIGIGLCGVADALSKLGLSYASDEARNIVTDVMAIINLSSKKESVKLAQSRGACGAMMMTKGNRYLQGNFLQRMFMESSKKTNAIDFKEWKKLDRFIAETKLLRNTSTTAVPPTGRSALIIDASPGIEPHFSLKNINKDIKKAIKYNLINIFGKERSYLFDDILNGNFSIIQHPEERQTVEKYLATASTIAPEHHLKMLASVQCFTDEAVSKTINLPSIATAEDVKKIYLDAWRFGLNGVTIYVDKSRSKQPKRL